VLVLTPHNLALCTSCMEGGMLDWQPPAIGFYVNMVGHR